MISEKMKGLVRNNSVIRQMFEEGQRLSEEFGPENVYDFSLGNPNVPPPDRVREKAVKLLEEEDACSLHGYMNNAGFPEVRSKIAENLNRRFGTAFHSGNIMMSVGAASAINCALKAILNPGDEVITFAPFFVEYRNYVNNYDGVLVTVEPDPGSFQPRLSDFEAKISAKTKAVIINNPNNPTGVIYREETIKSIAEILTRKMRELNTEIFIISDEPYRELVYTDTKVPFITKYYPNTMVCYSFSKSMSLPGERIGYLIVPDEAADAEELFAAATIANRVLGSVNAPSLFQKVVAECLEEKADISFYGKNRDTVYEALKNYGFDCVLPEGAFYLFVKSPVPDEKEFVSECKKERILLVPGSSFDCPGYVRLAYCVSHETILRSLPGFKRVAEHYGLKGSGV
ncbi:MAG: pyridoxal phosphate-dependent aminotransferase [Lachnospiraceae bacterium]|nr:pyridoxal phosphate-dependent aminotransferase [Lachnospiraceae bacterium]